MNKKTRAWAIKFGGKTNLYIGTDKPKIKEVPYPPNNGHKILTVSINEMSDIEKVLNPYNQ